MTQKQPEPPSKILMLAPMAIVLIVYCFGFFSPQQSKLRSTQARYDTLSETHHQTEHDITDIQYESGKFKKQMRDLDSQIHDLQHGHDDLLAKRSQLLHELESHSLPAATMQGVTRLMEEHQLHVIGSQPDSGAARQMETTLKSVRDLLKDDESRSNSHLASHHGSHHAHHTHHRASPQHTHFAREVYKLKVRGRFQDLQAALESLADQLEHVLPLSLQMEPIELDSTEARQSQRVWTLTILV